MRTTSKKAKKQFEMQKKKFNDDINELSDAARKAMEFRLQGETDYSLMNYILTVFDFTDVKDLNEAIFSFYRHIYVHLASFQRDNEALKDLLAKQISNMSDEDKVKTNQLLEKNTPFQMAHDFLNELKERAKTRARSGIIAYSEEDAKEMGLDIK